MAAMKRERQWDMFDVATGACGLDDYLFQRYSENDLMSKFWVEPTDQVDELRPPPKGSKEQIVIPVQGPSVGPPKPAAPVSNEPLPSRPPWEAAPAAESLPTRPPWEAVPPVPAPPAPVAHARAPMAPPPPPPAAAATPAAPAPAPPPPAAQQPPAAPWQPSGPVAPTPAEPAPQPAAPQPAAPSMAELLARFHQATKAYEERAKDTLGEPLADPPEADPTG